MHRKISLKTLTQIKAPKRVKGLRAALEAAEHVDVAKCQAAGGTIGRGM